MQGDYSRPKWHWLEVAGKVPGPLHDDEPSGGLRLAVKCRRHHFCARDERGVWTHHTGSCPNFGGGLVGKQPPPRSTMFKCRASSVSTTRKLGQRYEQNRNGCTYEFNCHLTVSENALSPGCLVVPKNLKSQIHRCKLPHLV